jgi:hypothetical protein
MYACRGLSFLEWLTMKKIYNLWFRFAKKKILGTQSVYSSNPTFIVSKEGFV